MRLRTIRATVAIVFVALGARPANAAPSTTDWAPSTATWQARGLPHVTYDTYFRKGPAAGSAGAWGFGSYMYSAEHVSLLVGPVFFLDKRLQPGGSRHMWTAQRDVDVPLGR